jgi:hypothetical protein
MPLHTISQPGRRTQSGDHKDEHVRILKKSTKIQEDARTARAALEVKGKGKVKGDISHSDFLRMRELRDGPREEEPESKLYNLDNHDFLRRSGGSAPKTSDAEVSETTGVSIFVQNNFPKRCCFQNLIVSKKVIVLITRTNMDGGPGVRPVRADFRQCFTRRISSG